MTGRDGHRPGRPEPARLRPSSAAAARSPGRSGGSAPAPALRTFVGRMPWPCRRTAGPAIRVVRSVRQRAGLRETAGRSCGRVPSSGRSRGRRPWWACTGPRRVSPRRPCVRPRRRLRGPMGTTTPAAGTAPRSRPPNVGPVTRTRSDFKATFTPPERRSTTTTRHRLTELVPDPAERRPNQRELRNGDAEPRADCHPWPPLCPSPSHGGLHPLTVPGEAPPCRRVLPVDRRGSA
jgi:hypothetical protein